MIAIGEPRWLSEEQQVIWRAYLAGVARINMRMDSDLRPFGLDLAEYEILVCLSESDGLRMRMSDLAEAALLSRSRLTHTITRMEDKGHVLRMPCHEDRRGVVAVLTAQGLTLLQETAPHHVESVRRAFVDVVDPTDFAAIGRAMAAVIAAVSSDS